MLIFRKGLIFAAGLVALCVTSEAWAGKWSLGGFVDYNSPARSLRARYNGVRKFTGALNYVRSDAMTVSIEYNRSNFTHGKLETIPFKWRVDDKFYLSPNGSSTMKFNAYLINVVIYPGQENQSHGYKPKDYRWYLLVGGGYNDYKQVNQGFVYPGQLSAPLNTNLVIDPQIDDRVAMNVNLGAGVEAFITDSWALDVRARYNVIIGELRPLLQWKLERVWPIQLFDVGVGMKFYFWR